VSVFNAAKVAQSALKILNLTEGVLDMTDNQDTPPDTENENGGEEKEKRTLIEEIEIEGRQLVDRVREIIKEGNVRRLIIKDEGGKYLLEVPLTVGVVAGGVFALVSPVAAALGALAALVTKVKVEVVREVEDEADEADDD
jgi:glutamate mutase epsilon subunit